MSWLYSRALVEEYLADTCSDGKPSVPLSSIPTQQAYLSQDKMKAFSRLSRFGMTFKPLTDDLGAALLTWYLGDFRAKTSPAQEEAQESPESAADSGQKWRASFATFDPDLSLWKTHQFSLLGGLTEYSETWPRWGLMRDGECWELPTWERRTSGIASGSLHGSSNKALTQHADKWATPTTMDSLPPKSQKALLKEATQIRPGRSKPSNLRDQVSNFQNWPTPKATSGGAVMRWATPVARDHRTPALSRVERTGSSQGDPLNTQVGGMLNPVWVEWLMGWPFGWTDLKPLAMDKFQQWQQQHSGY
jgi:hypothetical protein